MAGNVLEFTDSTFQSEVLGAAGPVMVDFWAPWCVPCRRLAPTIEKLATEYQGKVKIGKLDTDQNTQVPGDLRIAAIPTIIFFKDGKEVDRLVGGQHGEATFRERLTKLGVG
jgi:thioredoxin 1